MTPLKNLTLRLPSSLTVKIKILAHPFLNIIKKNTHTNIMRTKVIWPCQLMII